MQPPVHDGIITSGGLHLHYRNWGDPVAPALVVLHACTSHARSWNTVARDLANHL